MWRVCAVADPRVGVLLRARQSVAAAQQKDQEQDGNRHSQEPEEDVAGLALLHRGGREAGKILHGCASFANGLRPCWNGRGSACSVRRLILVSATDSR